MSRINLWLGSHKKSIQVALFPLWSLNEFGRLRYGKMSTKKKQKTKKKKKEREKNASVIVKTRA